MFDSATDADAKAQFLPDVADLESTIEAYTATGDGMGGITMDVNAVVVEGDTATATRDEFRSYGLGQDAVPEMELEHIRVLRAQCRSRPTGSTCR